MNRPPFNATTVAYAENATTTTKRNMNEQGFTMMPASERA